MLIKPSYLRSAWGKASKRHASMFSGQFNRPIRSKSADNITNVLHVNVSHGPGSLVAISSKELLDNLTFPHRINERDLWKDELVSYNLSHVAAKFRLLSGKGSPEDERHFEPVRTMALELNDSRLLICSTPMWNFSVPYVLKQYLDIVIQPGLNFVERPDEHPVTEHKSAVIITSSGGQYKDDNPRDFLVPYLKEMFRMVGYNETHVIRIQGTSTKKREDLERIAKDEALKLADVLNRKFVAS